MRYLADQALVDGAVVADVVIDIGADGVITDVARDTSARAERLHGLVVPGMPNLHSHAFQRAMAGLAERPGPSGDSFWRWREVMYRFLAALTPDDVEAIAARLYVECLLQGYTTVAEFHYLHNAPDGSPYADPTEMARRIGAAADTAGIRLTLLPVLYRHGGFGGAPPTDGQRRFVLSLDAYADLCQTMGCDVRVGIAPHSLRAVTPDELTEAIKLATTLGEHVPIHIHVAEQVKEVADCLAWSGARPVAWLLDHAPVDAHWCLVHATHSDADECARLARSGAVVGLCQTTEANLGDGIFPLIDFLAGGGRFGIGSDANLCTNPVEELRWLEYVRRLQTKARNVTDNIWQRALSGGTQAIGQSVGAIAAGKRADLVVLDTAHPSLIGRTGEALLDAWVFSSSDTPVRDVMVAGEWVVHDRQHVRQDAIARAFAHTMQRLLRDH
jgi:formimidoylglutamate deiminase